MDLYKNYQGTHLTLHILVHIEKGVYICVYSRAKKFLRLRRTVNKNTLSLYRCNLLVAFMYLGQVENTLLKSKILPVQPNLKVIVA